MPPKSSSSPPCTHSILCTTTTSHAQKCGFVRPSLFHRLAAATSPSTPTATQAISITEAIDSAIYPAPLVLPGSEIALYPNARGQSLRNWLSNGGVNRVTEERKTVYISLPPGYGEGVRGMRGWTVPKGFDVDEEGKRMGMGLDYELVAKYVGVFYHGLPVKVLPEGEFSWILDGDGYGDGDSEASATKKNERGKGRGKGKGKGKGTSKPKPRFDEDPRIGLRAKSSSEYTVIRSRPTPNYPYSNQLKLNDILDFAIASLPDDAYALLMLLEHDLYEDEEDEFVCGRAYGGSRVAVMSGARYWPGFDEEEGVERVHGWPASHCERHIQTLLDDNKAKTGNKSKGIAKKSPVGEMAEKMGDAMVTPLHRALAVYKPPTSPGSLRLLHIARLARTASHELGHCVGIGHCTYYACIMQGSSSLAEDARQPLYLCPVDEAKVLRATAKGTVSEKRMEAWRRERLVEMRDFCSRVVVEWEVDGEGSMFQCLEAWIGALLEVGNGGRKEGREEKTEGERVVIDLTMDD